MAVASKNPIAKYGPEPSADLMAAARVIYEGQPYSTHASVGAEVGIPMYWVRRWCRLQEWKKSKVGIPDMSSRAATLANSFQKKMSDLGKPMDDVTAAAEAAAEFSRDTAIGVRARVLDRHRTEWSAPRNIAYNAIKKATGPTADVAAAFEMAKLAKITAETLSLVQAGECRAYGITADAKSGDAPTAVLVERSTPAEAKGVMPPVDLGTDPADDGDDGEVF
jgi:hypothetical protein